MDKELILSNISKEEKVKIFFTRVANQIDGRFSRGNVALQNNKNSRDIKSPNPNLDRKELNDFMDNFFFKI